ncbi:MAG: alpha/beta hydrolase [Muribaculaceae bacterium]|jgi:pimeloyl-ACP methyl ester carboxylesterase|nr:alpha/beta hydrolase [Muribaculaceae bacterium]
MKKKLEIKGVEFCYTVEGEGVPVVLMHGWGCNHTTVASIENMLLPNLKVYNVDFPGFGESTEPETIWGIEDYTQLIEEFIKAEKIEKPILIGHSFGGRVGILYASRNEVRKMILVDAAGVKPKRSLKYYYKVYTYKAVKKALPIIFGKTKGNKMLDEYRGKVGSSDYNSATQKMRTIMSRVVNEDLKWCMPKIKCPTLMIWGEKDTATPLSDAKTMEKLIPGSGLVAFEGVGHYSFLENPIQFRAVLMSFLEKEMKAEK